MQPYTPITHKDITILATLPKASILVWLKMRIYAGKGNAYPTRAKMAEELSMSLPSINRAFRDLEKRCLIQKTTNHTVIKNNSYMIKNDLLTIKNDQSVSSEMIIGSDQKRSLAMIKNDQQNRESNRENNNKRNSSTGPAIQDKDAGSLSLNERAALAASPQGVESDDERDEWIGALWAKHSMEQGWRSNDIRKDFDTLKHGLSVVQVAKAVRKIDSYITINQCSGFYRGLGWCRKMREQWFAREKPQISAHDRDKMSASDILIGSTKTTGDNDQAGQQKPTKQDVPGGNTRAHQVWARFEAKHENYEQQAEAVLAWRRAGGGDDDLISEAAKHEDLVGFHALLTMPIVSFGGV